MVKGFESLSNNSPHYTVKDRYASGFTSSQRDVQKIFNRYLQIQRDKRLGMLSEFPKHIMHEGNSSRIVRPDGKVDETELKLASVEMSVKADEVVNLTFNECLARLDQLADDMARQMSAQFFGELNKTLDKAGQVVDQKRKAIRSRCDLCCI